MKPEELRELARETARRIPADPKHPASEFECSAIILTALQQAVDVQREADEVAMGHVPGYLKALEIIRAGKQTVQEESEGV